MAFGVDHAAEGPVELDLHLDERLLALHRNVLDLGHVRAVAPALPYLQVIPGKGESIPWKYSRYRIYVPRDQEKMDLITNKTTMYPIYVIIKNPSHMSEC